MTNIVLVLPSIADGEDKSSQLANRIRKNYRHLRKWAKRTDTDCFRIYDKEMHEYPLAIDFYAGRFCVQYFSKGRDELEPPEDIVKETEKSLQTVFGADKSTIYWKTRSKSKQTRQYEKFGESKEFFSAYEYGLKFQINLADYLDTGLFLDHRETRKLVAAECKGKRLLNLFAYTCSFSVHAAAAGSVFTKSVDMSNTYTEWGKNNFVLNSFPLKDNEVVRADCLKFLDQEILSKDRYDVIVIDPPTISRSKKMTEMFDIQEDYIPLIQKSLKLLNEGGCIFFSTNSRKFTFDESVFEKCAIEEISHKTIPVDFHNQKMHRCWKIRKA